MGKLKLTKRDVKAVNDSVAHWKRDVLTKLKKGIKIKETIFGLIWADNSKEVKCYSRSCPLCRIYYDNFCAACPYYKKYGISCTYIDDGVLTGHWRTFRQNPCLKTCSKMIKALENILI